MWPRFGFRENPYSNEGLPPNEVGDALLVGRDTEVASLQTALASGGAHPSIEGATGVGKSSLIAVAAYRMEVACTANPSGTLFLPATEFFQMSTSVEALETHVYQVVAQTLIANVEAFRRAGTEIPDVARLDAWLNRPTYRSGSAAISGFGGGAGSTPNTSTGFTESGFPEAVRAELARLFPTLATGAVVCVLDNLELLQTPGRAREVLEVLRDRVFTLQGLRWVLCGSRGIVSRARSGRLSGFFSVPTTIHPLPYDACIDLVRTRIEEFGNDDAYPPVTPSGFEYLYRALHLNLRDALAYAQQFAAWLYAEYVLHDADLPSDDDLKLLLEGWIADLADRAFAETKGVQRRVWQFFDQVAAGSGVARAADWEDFKFTTQQQMGGSVTALETANLMVRETDPDNASLKLATITPSGWLIYFHRNRYDLPHIDELA